MCPGAGRKNLLGVERGLPPHPWGHLRIFRAGELRREIEGLGFDQYHHHWAHALHVPFWWLKCLFWQNRDTNWLVRQYHRLLVWDILEQPTLTRVLEKL